MPLDGSSFIIFKLSCGCRVVIQNLECALQVGVTSFYQECTRLVHHFFGHISTHSYALSWYLWLAVMIRLLIIIIIIIKHRPPFTLPRRSYHHLHWSKRKVRRVSIRVLCDGVAEPSVWRACSLSISCYILPLLGWRTATYNPGPQQRSVEYAATAPLHIIDVYY